MLHDFAQVAVGAVVEAELGEIEGAENADLLKEVVVVDAHLVTESVEVVALVDTEIVRVESMVEAVVVVVSWSCNIPLSCYFSSSEKSKEIEKGPDAWIP